MDATTLQRRDSAELGTERPGVSQRLRAWLSVGPQGISKRLRQQTAMRSGSLAALAALVVKQCESRTDHQPVIAVAKPLSLQPALFMALASELNYLTDQPIAFQLGINAAAQNAKSPRWSNPADIAERLQIFSRLITADAPPQPNELVVTIVDAAHVGSNELPSADILLTSRSRQEDWRATKLAGAALVELTPLV